MAEFPHFDLPLRFENGGLAVVEQDSLEDVQNKVETLVRCPQGFRDELPDFGWPRQTFATVPLDVSVNQSLIDEWVPDARATLTEHGESLDETVRHIVVSTNPEG
jgi:hypothetical protein